MLRQFHFLQSTISAHARTCRYTKEFEMRAANYNGHRDMTLWHYCMKHFQPILWQPLYFDFTYDLCLIHLLQISSTGSPKAESLLSKFYLWWESWLATLASAHPRFMHIHNLSHTSQHNKHFTRWSCQSCDFISYSSASDTTQWQKTKLQRHSAAAAKNVYHLSNFTSV